MKLRLRRIGTGSVFLLFFTLYGLVGFFVGLGITLVTALDVPTVAELTVLDRLGAWSLLIMPLSYGLVAGVAGGLAAVLYNLAAALSGGIELDLGGAGALEVEPAATSAADASTGAEGGEVTERTTDDRTSAPEQAGDPSRRRPVPALNDPVDASAS